MCPQAFNVHVDTAVFSLNSTCCGLRLSPPLQSDCATCEAVDAWACFFACEAARSVAMAMG